MLKWVWWLLITEYVQTADVFACQPEQTAFLQNQGFFFTKLIEHIQNPFRRPQLCVSDSGGTIETATEIKINCKGSTHCYFIVTLISEGNCFDFCYHKTSRVFVCYH